MITSGSGCRSRAVTGISGMGWRGLNSRSLTRWSICVLLVPILRTKKLLFRNAFLIL